MQFIKLLTNFLGFLNKKTSDKISNSTSTEKSQFNSAIKILDMNYQSINKRRIELEVKKTATQIKAYHKIHIGSLLQTKIGINARTEISTEEYKTGWVVIPEGSILMFMGVYHDYNYDAVTLKVLCESKIFFIHKNANFSDFNNDFEQKFQILL